jgi:hypothetical protein
MTESPPAVVSSAAGGVCDRCGGPVEKREKEQWMISITKYADKLLAGLKDVDQLPGVHHYSWYDLERKIKLYKNYWTRHWNSLHGRNADDTAENNMMFDVPWSEVTDVMIKDRAKELAEKTGGHIWHKKWTGFSTPHMTVNRPEPKVMKK